MFPFSDDFLETITFYIQMAYTIGFLVIAGIAGLLIKKYVINRR
jgi:hypothetical protein